MFHSNVQKLFNKTFTLGVMKNFLSLNTKMFFLQIFAWIFNNISLFLSEGQSLGIYISIYRITYLLLKTNPKDVIFFFSMQSDIFDVAQKSYYLVFCHKD